MQNACRYLAHIDPVIMVWKHQATYPEVRCKQMIDETYALDCMRSGVEFSRYN